MCVQSIWVDVPSNCSSSYIVFGLNATKCPELCTGRIRLRVPSVISRKCSGNCPNQSPLAMENFGKPPCFKHLKNFLSQMRNCGLQSHPVAKSARQSSPCFSIPRGDNNNLSNRGRSSGKKSEMLYWAERIGCSISASPFCPVGFFNFSKNAGGRDAGETSVELKIGRNWSHTLHTTYLAHLLMRETSALVCPVLHQILL